MFLVRDLVSPRTWLAMISHLAGLFLGLAVMVVVVTGLSLGFSLLVLALVGLPILGLTLRAATLYATSERARRWVWIAFGVGLVEKLVLFAFLIASIVLAYRWQGRPPMPVGPGH